MDAILQTNFTVGDFLGLVGNVVDTFAIVCAVAVVSLSILGLLKPIWRFGLGVAWRKVFIVAGGDSRSEIRNDLIRSGIVKERNIKMKTRGEIGDLKGARLLILEYGYLGEESVSDIISHKDPNCGVLVYAKPGEIPGKVMEELNLSQHVSVVNFRGRLVNEILLLLLSTSFTRKDIKGQIS